MKKIFLILFLLAFVASAQAAQWDKGEIDGDTEINDIDTVNQANNDALDRLLAGYRKGMVIQYSSASAVSVSAGEVVVSTSLGVKLMLRNTSSTSVGWADIDTGAEEASTTYYVYAIAAAADSETATFKISKSATAPSGITYYAKLGSFYNNSSSNITYTSNASTNSSEYIEPSRVSEGTFSAGVTYQNTTSHKLLIVVYGQANAAAVDIDGQIGEISGSLAQVVKYYDPTTGLSLWGSMTFVVPPGWYWKVTQTAGSVTKIESWEI